MSLVRHVLTYQSGSLETTASVQTRSREDIYLRRSGLFNDIRTQPPSFSMPSLETWRWLRALPLTISTNRKSAHAWLSHGEREMKRSSLFTRRLKVAKVDLGVLPCLR